MNIIEQRFIISDEQDEAIDLLKVTSLVLRHEKNPNYDAKSKNTTESEHLWSVLLRYGPGKDDVFGLSSHAEKADAKLALKNAVCSLANAHKR